jgi:hypothetical protein
MEEIPHPLFAARPAAIPGRQIKVAANLVCRHFFQSSFSRPQRNAAEAETIAGTGHSPFELTLS